MRNTISTAKTTLGSPLQLARGEAVRNRIFKSAMSEQLGDRQHNPTPGLATLYGRWAEGGIGLQMSGNIMISRTALGEPRNVVLDESSDLSEFRSWTAAGTANGTHFWAQLNHPGKQIPKFICDEPVAPSAIPLQGGLEKGFNTPRALTEPEIHVIIAQFAASARLAKEVGFTGIQIHGAHGYLVSQFLSPRHNQRTDAWGGTSAKRRRFALAVYEAIRAVVGDDYPVGIKLNSADFQKGGFTEEESMDVIVALAKAGIDLIEISGGTYESPAMVGRAKAMPMKDSTIKREAYFLHYAEQVRTRVTTPLVVTGGFRSAAGMQDALDSGACDMVGVARPMAILPDLPQRVINDSDYAIKLRPLTTGVRAVDRMAMLDITWYEHQMARLAKGKESRPQMSEWWSFAATLTGSGLYALQKRRA